jgi:iron complex transport system substrate-binding protein
VNIQAPAPSSARRDRRGRIRCRSLATTVAALAIALSACATGASPSVATPAAPTGSIEPAATATPSPSPSAAPAFPTTLTDDEGTAVKLTAEPHKIVSLTPSATETLFALGVGDRVVGKVEDVSLYPPEAAAVPDVAKFGTVDVEKIVSLGTDLVIAGGNNFNPPDKIAQLRTLGVPVVVLYAPDVPTVFSDIELIGMAVGKVAEAKDMTTSMKAGFDQIQSATTGLPKPRVFYEIDASQKIYTAADNSFLAAMIVLAGGTPITTGSTTNFEIPLETLITKDPELILLGDAAYGTTAEIVAARPGWKVMTAVKANAIKPVDDVVITRPGPRLVEGLRDLAAAIHPDANLPSAAPAASGVTATAEPAMSPSAAP